MTIFISGLRVYAFHGVLPQERLVGGDYLVDVRVDYSHSLATESDRVEDTLDYSRLHHLIDEEMAIPSALLEHVAGRITWDEFRMGENHQGQSPNGCRLPRCRRRAHVRQPTTGINLNK